MKKSTETRVDIKAIESAAGSKIRGENKLKGALASVAAQHMLGEASPDLYAMVRRVEMKGSRPDLAPIRESLPTLGRAQKDAVSALYLVLTTEPAKCVKAWDKYEKARALAAKQSGKKARAVGVTLFGLRDAINSANAPAPSNLDKPENGKANGKQDNPKAPPFETAVGMAETLAKFIKKNKFNADEIKIIMDKLA